MGSIVVNTTEYYDDPRIYAAEYGGHTADLPLFLNAIESGHVLDLACGTGRVTIPLAQKGFTVAGLDTSEVMLSFARQKGEGLPITWIQGDMASFDLRQTFDLITIAGNSFQVLLDRSSQLSMLQSVRCHLTLHGRFIFSTRNPLPEKMIPNDVFEYWHDFKDHERVTVRVEGKQSYDPHTQLMIYITKRIWPDHETVSEIQIRFTGYDELMALLTEAGFVVTHVYGDVDQSPYHKNSPSIIPVCQLAS